MLVEKNIYTAIFSPDEESSTLAWYHEHGLYMPRVAILLANALRYRPVSKA
jgi:hypothetical protein